MTKVALFDAPLLVVRLSHPAPRIESSIVEQIARSHAPAHRSSTMDPLTRRPGLDPGPPGVTPHPVRPRLKAGASGHRNCAMYATRPVIGVPIVPRLNPIISGEPAAPPRRVTGELQ